MEDELMKIQKMQEEIEDAKEKILEIIKQLEKALTQELQEKIVVAQIRSSCSMQFILP